MHTGQRQEFIVIGGGGHGREVALAITRAAPDARIAVHDDREPDAALLAELSARWVGGIPDAQVDAYIGVGNPEVRRTISERAASAPPPLVDPSAVLGAGACLGAGAIVFALSHISTNVTIGRHSHVGPSATVAHDCRIGDYVTVMPGAAIGGAVTIGEGTYVGANSVVEHNVVVGCGVTITTGSVVLDHVADGTIVAGNPARPVERN